MTTTTRDEVPIREAADIVIVRQLVRARASDLGFTLVDLTKLVTAASELARNTLVHGGGGTAHIETLNGESRIGLRLTFEDKGPGIADIDLALRDGYTTGGGLGLGLGGSKRLVNEFEIESRPREGTRVQVIRWR